MLPIWTTRHIAVSLEATNQKWRACEEPSIPRLMLSVAYTVHSSVIQNLLFLCIMPSCCVADGCSHEPIHGIVSVPTVMDNPVIWNPPGTFFSVFFQEVMENWYFKEKVMEMPWNCAQTINSVFTLFFHALSCMHYNVYRCSHGSGCQERPTLFFKEGLINLWFNVVQH